MRKPKSISPSALGRFEKDREDYFFTYICDSRTPREPQSEPASVGSSFDAYVKAELIKDVLGKPDEFEALFESQVESHNRDFAREAGAHVMESYVTSGAYISLVEMMEEAKEDPQFEFDADTTIGDIPIAGKPDCRFVHRGGAHVILDWKVNGYCGKSGTSPSKGYALCMDGKGWPKPSRSHGKSHSLYKPREFLGLEINEFCMEQVSIDWADQLSMYGWMMGEEVGSDKLVVCIDQVVAKPNGEKPLLRIANHRCQVSPAHQQGLVQRLNVMWESTQTGHIFNEVSEEDSRKKCEELEKRSFSMLSDGTDEGDFFAKCAKPKKFYSAR